MKKIDFFVDQNFGPLWRRRGVPDRHEFAAPLKRHSKLTFEAAAATIRGASLLILDSVIFQP